MDSWRCQRGGTAIGEFMDACIESYPVTHNPEPGTPVASGLYNLNHTGDIGRRGREKPIPKKHIGYLQSLMWR
jgi:hypothetical protein